MGLKQHPSFVNFLPAFCCHAMSRTFSFPPHINGSQWLRFIFLIAASSIFTCAKAQNTHKNDSTLLTTSCPSVQDIGPAHLYGLWRADFYDKPLPDDMRQPPGQTPNGKATLLFERHPDHADSLSGTLRRPDPRHGNDQKAWLSGDVEDGELVMDESENGQSIAAVWVGQVVGHACGKEIRGVRRLAGDDDGQAFILKKVPGWQ